MLTPLRSRDQVWLVDLGQKTIPADFLFIFCFFIERIIVFEQVKDHVKRHQVAYSFGVGFGIAGITCLIMRSSIARGVMCGGLNARGVLTNTASFNLSNRQILNITTVLDREGRGHPGWPVRNLETKRIFFSQREAAKTFDIPEDVLSGHLKGKFANVDGLHFERVNLISAP
jgi:hypothetical protein